MALSDDQKAMLRLLAQREQGYDDIASLTGSGIDEVRSKVKQAIARLDGTLSGDQRAMLRLLAQREEGYGDIAALTGSSVEDVRARVKDALAGLEGEAGAAKPVPPPAPPEPTPPPVEPEARPAPAPKPPPKTERAAPKEAAKKSSPGGLKLPEDKGAMRALAAGAAVVLVIVLLLVTGALGGDDGGSDPTATTGESPPSTEANLPTGGEKVPTQAVLEPVGGLDAGGRALFGRDGQAVVLLLRADGLPPSPKGRSYTVSLVRSAEERLPLIATKVGADGVINGQFQVAAQVLGLLAAGFDEMEVSLVDDDTLRVALAQAQKEGKAPAYGGATVLRGDVTGPIVAGAEDEG